jgi:uncharacterized protein (TIGR04222 family)
MSPFDMTGGPFLQLYFTLFVMVIVAGFVIPRWLKPEGRTARSATVDELAFLAGGRARFTDALVSRLLARRALSMVGKDRFEADRREPGMDAAERSVLALPAPTRWSTIEHALKRYADPVEEKLVSADLLMDRGTAWQMRFWQTLPYFLLLGFGAIKWEVGVSRDRPVGFLTMFLIATAIFALIRFVAVDRLTRGGVETLAEARRRSERLRRAPTPMETDMGVALFGTAVLAGSSWSEFHTLRSSSSGDSGSSGGGDGGGSGCGGGGCGGCGGS